MIFTEIKARKAKYGFNFGGISLRNVVEIGRFIEAIRTEFDEERYDAEEAGYHQPDFKIYTNDVAVAEWIRNYKS